MQDVKTMLKGQFKDGQLQERLQEVAATIVREIVRQEVGQRVRRQVGGFIGFGVQIFTISLTRFVLAARTSHTEHEGPGGAVSKTNFRN